MSTAGRFVDRVFDLNHQAMGDESDWDEHGKAMMDLAREADELVRELAAARADAASWEAQANQRDEIVLFQGARADKAEAEIAALREALEIIAGRRQCADNLMSNVDVAVAAIDAAKEIKT